MGLFGKLFEKKECAICGGEIGLLGNRKLEDGNMCKACAAKLSPWFDERRHSTVAQIEEQLEYRESNKENVAAFRTTLSLGETAKVLVDEDAGRFMVTSARNYSEANPDVLELSDITGCTYDIDEGIDEVTRFDENNEAVSYDPPRFTHSYNFYVTVYVNNPYFDDMRFKRGAGLRFLRTRAASTSLSARFREQRRSIPKPASSTVRTATCAKG